MKNRKGKINNKGFTLVELLGVIIVLAIIMAIAVISISNVIEQSKKNALKDTAVQILNGVRTHLISVGELNSNSKEGYYYFTSSLNESGGATSPLGGEFSYINSSNVIGDINYSKIGDSGIYRWNGEGLACQDTAISYVKVTKSVDGNNYDYSICLSAGQDNYFVTNAIDYENDGRPFSREERLLDNNDFAMIVKGEYYDASAFDGVINLMNTLPDVITKYKKNVSEIYFLGDYLSDIEARYNMAEIKADITYNNQGKVLAWLEKDYYDKNYHEYDYDLGKYVDGMQYYKLYIGSQGKTYINTGESLFANFINMKKILFTNIDTSMATSFNKMLYYCENVESLDMSMFDTSNVSDMSYMLYYVRAKSASFANWNLSNLNAEISYYSSFLSGYLGASWSGTIEKLSFRNTNFGTIRLVEFLGFYSAITDVDFTDCDTSHVTDMSYMFDDCDIKKLDLSSFDTSNVTNMARMFAYCWYLEDLNIDGWDTSNVTDMTYMFIRCGELKSIDLSTWDTSSCTSLFGLLYDCESLVYANLSNFSFVNCTYSASSILAFDVNLKTVYMDNLDLSVAPYGMYCNDWLNSDSNIEFISMRNTKFFSTTPYSQLFRYTFYLNSSNAILDLTGSKFNADCSQMFYYLKIKEIILDGVDWSSVQNAYHMFSYFEGEKIWLDSVDVSNIENLSYMFCNCKLDSLYLKNLNFSKATNGYEMFGYATIDDFEFNNISFPSLTDGSYMFSSSCFNKTNFSNVVFNKLLTAYSMFYYYNGYNEIDLSSFDIGNCPDISYIFGYSKLKKVNISNWNFKNTNASGMFSSCQNLEEVIFGDSNLALAFDISNIFNCCPTINININMFGVPNFNINSASSFFWNSSTSSDYLVTIYCDDKCSSYVDEIISNNSNSNIVKKIITLSSHNIILNSDKVTVSKNQASTYDLITLSAKENNKLVKSFKINNKLVSGNSFEMINSDVTISDVTLEDGIILETAHYPYTNDSKSAYFPNATYLEVSITYEAVDPYNRKDKNGIYVYDENNDFVKWLVNSSKTTEIFYVNGPKIKLLTYVSSSATDLMNYYGMKATIKAHYDDLPKVEINSNNVTLSKTSGVSGTKIYLNSNVNGKIVSSFKMNGNVIDSDYFTMSNGDVKITDVQLSNGKIFESSHYPYLPGTFNLSYPGATYLTVDIYSDITTTYNSNNHGIELYDSLDELIASFGSYSYTKNVPGSSVKFVIKDDSSTDFSQYYGYRIKVYANYENYVINLDDSENYYIVPSLVAPDISYKIVAKNGNLVKSFKYSNGSSGYYDRTYNDTDTFTLYDYDGSYTFNVYDIVSKEAYIIESSHDPYPNNMNNVVLGEKTYSGASSLSVSLTYQTESTTYDWIYLYDKNGKAYGKYGGSSKTTTNITIPGDYVKVVFRSDSSSNYYYGVSAAITPNY